jgi:hypothetical protein
MRNLKDIIIERLVLSKERKRISGSGNIDFILECSSKDKSGRTFELYFIRDHNDVELYRGFLIKSNKEFIYGEESELSATCLGCCFMEDFDNNKFEEMIKVWNDDNDDECVIVYPSDACMSFSGELNRFIAAPLVDFIIHKLRGARFFDNDYFRKEFLSEDYYIKK